MRTFILALLTVTSVGLAGAGSAKAAPVLAPVPGIVAYAVPDLLSPVQYREEFRRREFQRREAFERRRRYEERRRRMIRRERRGF